MATSVNPKKQEVEFVKLPPELIEIIEITRTNEENHTDFIISAIHREVTCRLQNSKQEHKLCSCMNGSAEALILIEDTARLINDKLKIIIGVAQSEIKYSNKITPAQ